MKIKIKLLFGVLVSVALLNCPVSASADLNSNWAFNYHVGDTFTVESDSFTYSTGYFGICLENTPIELDNCYMVSGIAKNKENSSIVHLVMTSINDDVNGCRQIMPIYESVFKNCSIDEIQVGDILKINGGCGTDDVPGHFYSESVEYVGNGVDIFGEDFKKVIRHEWVDEAYSDKDAEYYDYLPITDKYSDYLSMTKGDVTEDESVDILDVISINRNILGKQLFNSYGNAVADVNQNGMADPDDALRVMKHIVGIIDEL